MIKGKYNITIRDYDRVERNGEVYQLKRWYNILPTFLFVDRITSLLTELKNEINNESNDSDIENENIFWQTESLNAINAIETCYYGLKGIEFRDLSNSLKTFYQKFTWRKLRIIKSRYSDKYLSEINRIAGIKVTSNKDLERVRKNIEFRKDKYNENFSNDTKSDGKRVYLIGLAFGIYSYLNQTLDPDKAKVMDYVEARKTAIAKSTIKKEDNVRA
jgi:hypothetical protein